MPPSRSRPRFRAVTWMVAGVVAGALVLVTLIGHRSSGNNVWMRWWHGWPFPFIQRQVEATREEPYGRWFSAADIVYVSLRDFAAQLLFTTAVLVGASWRTETWARRWNRNLKLSLRSALAVTAWIGTCGFLLHRSYFEPTKWYFWHDLMAQVATVVIVVAALLAWLAVFDVVGWIFTDPGKRNAKTNDDGSARPCS